MTDIKELATLTAAEMDNIYLRNVPAIILEQYATRFLKAYTEAQEPALKNVDTEWLASVLRYAEKNPDYFPDVADGKYSICGEDAEFISNLYAAPPLPAIPDGCVVVGWLDGRGRFFYADDPMYKNNHKGMREVIAAGEVKP